MQSTNEPKVMSSKNETSERHKSYTASLLPMIGYNQHNFYLSIRIGLDKMSKYQSGMFTGYPVPDHPHYSQAVSCANAPAQDSDLLLKFGLLELRFEQTKHPEFAQDLDPGEIFLPSVAKIIRNFSDTRAMLKNQSINAGIPATAISEVKLDGRIEISAPKKGGKCIKLFSYVKITGLMEMTMIGFLLDEFSLSLRISMQRTAVHYGNHAIYRLLENSLGKRELQSHDPGSLIFRSTIFKKTSNQFEFYQRACIDRLKKLPCDADFLQLRRSRAQLSWLVHSRPDICVIASKLAQVTESTLERKHINMFNNAIDYLLESRDLSLHMWKIDLEFLHNRAFTDASFSTNHGHTSRLGYIFMLCDKQDNACILHYASYKSRRIARSVLGADTYAFVDA